VRAANALPFRSSARLTHTALGGSIQTRQPAHGGGQTFFLALWKCAMNGEFQVSGQNAAALFALKLYCGDDIPS